MIVAGGAAGGLIFGLGLLFLTVPPLVPRTDAVVVHEIRGGRISSGCRNWIDEQFANDFAMASVADGKRASANRRRAANASTRRIRLQQLAVQASARETAIDSARDTLRTLTKPPGIVPILRSPRSKTRAVPFRRT